MSSSSESSFGGVVLQAVQRDSSGSDGDDIAIQQAPAVAKVRARPVQTSGAYFGCAVYVCPGYTDKVSGHSCGHILTACDPNQVFFAGVLQVKWHLEGTSDRRNEMWISNGASHRIRKHISTLAWVDYIIHDRSCMVQIASRKGPGTPKGERLAEAHDFVAASVPLLNFVRSCGFITEFILVGEQMATCLLKGLSRLEPPRDPDD